MNGPSMSPTLSPTYHETGNRDYLLMAKWNPTGNLKRGDVISFSIPHKPDGLGIKRVVGLSGDWVELDPKRRPDNDGIGGGVGKGLVWDLMGEMHDYHQPESQKKKRVRVPYGHVWVEGDNWRLSRDSNYYGPISKSLINGKAICVVLPFSRWWSRPWEKYKIKTKVKEGEPFIPLAWEDL